MDAGVLPEGELEVGDVEDGVVSVYHVYVVLAVD